MAIQIFKNGGSQVVNEYGFEQYLKNGWVLDPADADPTPPVDPVDPVKDALTGLTKKQLIQYVMDNNLDVNLNMQMRQKEMVALVADAKPKVE